MTAGMRYRFGHAIRLWPQFTIFALKSPMLYFLACCRNTAFTIYQESMLNRIKGIQGSYDLNICGTYLLLLNEECPDDSVVHAVGTSRSTVCSLNGLLRLRNIRVLSWTQSRNPRKRDTTVTALWCRTELLQVLVS